MLLKLKKFTVYMKTENVTLVEEIYCVNEN